MQLETYILEALLFLYGVFMTVLNVRQNKEIKQMAKDQLAFAKDALEANKELKQEITNAKNDIIQHVWNSRDGKGS